MPILGEHGRRGGKMTVKATRGGVLYNAVFRLQYDYLEYESKATLVAFPRAT